MYLSMTAPAHLDSENSAYNVGGVIFQIANYLWKPIAFVSKSLSTVPLNLSNIQTEAYAIFICCTQIGYLFRDCPLIIRTDHENLQNTIASVGKYKKNVENSRRKNSVLFLTGREGYGTYSVLYLAG
jgi:RNase H-like domain found in reverse transcriptase